MNIKEILPTITSFSALHPISERAEPKISFWGCRYVEVDGYEGSLPLDALAAHSLKMIRQQRPNFSEEERLHGEFVERNINRIYEKKDELLSEKNYFTQFLAYAREFFSALYTCFCLRTYTTRCDWEGPEGPIGSRFPEKRPIPTKPVTGPMINGVMSTPL